MIRVKSAVESILHLIPSKNMVPKTTTSINKPTGDKIETSTYLNFVRDRICGNVSLLDIENGEDLINYTNKTPKNRVPQKQPRYGKPLLKNNKSLFKESYYIYKRE